MPHTNRKSNVPPQFKPAQFVNVALTDDDKQRIKLSLWDVDKFDVACENVLRAGYKISVKFDDRNDCFACWLVAPDASMNKGCILAGRGSTAGKAIKQAMFIHFVLLEQNWIEGEGIQRETLDD
jgi:hypothetical protein